MKVIHAENTEGDGQEGITIDNMNEETRLIFLVDDQEIILRILESDLRNVKNSMVMTFTSGEECLKNMYLKPEVVVLDYDLSGAEGNVLSGMEVLKEIKKESPETEVVMLSSHDQINVAVASMKSGAYDFVVKDEYYVNNVRHKSKNIFKKMSMLKELRYEKMMRWAISLGLIVALGVSYLVQHTLYAM